MSISIKSLLSSISVKLFVCFWLIALTSILTTHFISLNLNKESKVIELHKGDMHKLRNIKRKLEKKNITNIEEFFNQLPQRSQRSIIIKHLSSNTVIASEKVKHIPGLISYLTKNSLGKLTSIKYKNARFTGPVLLKINQESYQMILVAPDKNFVLGMYLKTLPTWLLIAIPLFVSMSLCWLLARSLTRPIVDIKDVSTKLGNGKLSVRVSKAAKRKDELGDLAQSFNLMAEKLEQNVSAHQRLLADVSHELRSPLTRMQIALGLIHRNPDDIEKRSKHLQRCENEIQRLDGMITDVLALSRIENTVPTLTLQNTNFISFLEYTIQESQFIANERNIHITLNAPANLQLSIDKQLFGSALNNILSNSIKYSPVDSHISVLCQTLKDDVLVSISDQGEGVPEDKLQHLFKPFYRVSEARDRESGGTGLGLAIAQQAISAHNGKISAQNNPDSGLTVNIAFPLKTQEHN